MPDNAEQVQGSAVEIDPSVREAAGILLEFMRAREEADNAASIISSISESARPAAGSAAEDTNSTQWASGVLADLRESGAAAAEEASEETESEPDDAVRVIPDFMEDRARYNHFESTVQDGCILSAYPYIDDGQKMIILRCSNVNYPDLRIPVHYFTSDGKHEIGLFAYPCESGQQEMFCVRKFDGTNFYEWFVPVGTQAYAYEWNNMHYNPLPPIPELPEEEEAGGMFDVGDVFEAGGMFDAGAMF